MTDEVVYEDIESFEADYLEQAAQDEGGGLPTPPAAVQYDEPNFTFAEAPASVSVKAYSSKGWNVLFTLRDSNEMRLLKRIGNLVTVLTQGGFTPTEKVHPAPAAAHPAAAHPAAPRAPAPPPPPPGSPQTMQQAAGAVAQNIGGVSTEILSVQSIAHVVTESGHHCLRVKAGKYSKYGVKAWEEVIPQVANGWQDWPVGMDFAPLPGMEYALVEGGKKVTAFTSHT